MDRQSSVANMTALVVGGNGMHGGNHVQHLVTAGVGHIMIVDPQNGKKAQNGVDVIHFPETLDDFLEGEKNLPLNLVIDASNDASHIPNLRKLLEHGSVGVICSEKPVASTAAEFREYRKLQTEASKQGIGITTCLPRIMDTPYIVLRSILPKLMSTYGSITAIKHTFGFKKDDTIISTGRDHLAHEISLVLYLLQGITPGKEVCYEEGTENFRDSATAYMCRGRIGSVVFEVGGDRRAETPSELVEIVMQNSAGITKILLDAKIGFISVQQQGGKEIDRYNTNPSHPVSRLTAVTNHLITMALGKTENYLADYIQREAIRGPATLFANHEALS